jgi:PAS domain S-box-containing protein
MNRNAPWLEGPLDDLDLAVVFVGLDRTISYANHEAHRLFGAQVGRLLGQAVDRLCVPERRGELRNLEDVLSGGGARRLRTVLRRDDGARVSVTATYEPYVDQNGHVIAVAARYELLAAGASLSPSMPPGSRAPLGSQPAPGRSRAPMATPSQRPQPSIPARIQEIISQSADSSSGVRGHPARHSEQRLMRVGAPELERRLQELENQLRWLEERLSQPASVAPLDEPHERAKALLAVSESRLLLRETMDLVGDVPDEIPVPPRLPKI